MQAARNTIMRGCEVCPKSEDIWLEAVRLQVYISLDVLLLFRTLRASEPIPVFEQKLGVVVKVVKCRSEFCCFMVKGHCVHKHKLQLCQTCVQTYYTDT